MGWFSPYPPQVFVWKNQWFLLQLATKCGSLYVADLRQMFIFLPILTSSVLPMRMDKNKKGLGG